jgi:hypothetical protein
MPAAKIIGLVENAGRNMTFDEGIAFIERSRRQVDRFTVAFPNADDIRSAPEYQNQLRQKIDELEADLLALMPKV